MGTECESGDGHNAGCAFSDPDTRSFGTGFNKAGGGVFAHLWDKDGVKMWHFSRKEIPADITSGHPDPSSWPIPQAAWSAKTCDIARWEIPGWMTLLYNWYGFNAFSHFYEHTLTLNTAVCGDWASGAFASSGCHGTCGEAVANPKNFKCKYAVSYAVKNKHNTYLSSDKDAKWRVNYISIYQWGSTFWDVIMDYGFTLLRLLHWTWVSLGLLELLDSSIGLQYIIHVIYNES